MGLPSSVPEPQRTVLQALGINNLEEPVEVMRCIRWHEGRVEESSLPIELQTERRPLGFGTRGYVYKGIITETGDEAAVKYITMHAKEDLRSSLDELNRLASMEPCPQLAQVYAAALLPSPASSTMWVAQELMDLGSMSDLLQRNRGRGVESPYLARIARELLRGLKYLHGRGMHHGRIKPTNVMHSATGAVKLTDYADVFSADFCGSWHFQITDGIYTAPERSMGLDWSADADVWSAGMVLHELAAGSFPWRFNSVPELFAFLFDEPEPRLDGASHPAALCDFTAWCLVRDRPGRPWAKARSMEGRDAPSEPQEADPEDLPPAPPAVIVVRTMTGEDVFGPAELPASMTAGELAQRVAAESGQKGMERCRQIKFLAGMRELTEEELLEGGSPGAVLALTCVACGRARASVEELLQHSFLASGVASKAVFADWLAMIR